MRQTWKASIYKVGIKLALQSFMTVSLWNFPLYYWYYEDNWLLLNDASNSYDFRGLAATMTRYWNFLVLVGCYWAQFSSVVRAFAHGTMDRVIHPSWWTPLSYFSFQPVFRDWCNKGRGMYYHGCGMVHTKEPLLLIGKTSLCEGSRFPLSLFEWSFTISDAL